jgi:hypothetical protein
MATKKEEKPKEPRKTFMQLIQKRKYTLTFTEPILGMSPLNKDIFRDFVLKKAREKNPNITDDMALDEAEMLTARDELEAKMTGFHKDDDGVYLLDYQCRGFFKTAANNLKLVVNITNFKSKLEDFVFIFPRHIYLQEKIDGDLARPLRADTAKGPRTSIACSEMINAGATIDIEIHLLPHPEITFPIIEEIMDYGMYQGISQWRNASYGRFAWKRKDNNEK